MAHIDLASPFLRQPELPNKDFAYPVTGREYLPVPERSPDRAFVDVLLSRRSRREFGPLAVDDMNLLLWLAVKTRLAGRDDSGHRWEGRPAPSAGGRHPIDTVVIDHADSGIRARLYDPAAHALCELQLADRQPLEELTHHVDDILPSGKGTLFWFVAQFGRTMAKYASGESLVWRDAGALLTIFCLVGEVLGLSCCAIGITGEPAISISIGDPERLRGVGGCVVGGRL